MEEYCNTCDDLRPVTEAEIKRLDQGDIEFTCRECSTKNRNIDATRSSG
ncbi:hypothetical protein [Kocuria sp.]|nr:hypothetical protein [Kocuria sp.]MDO4919902.1 hypothetical protein [Kocuria sp.]